MSLLESLEQETVSRLALREAITLAAEGTVREAVEAMREGGLGCVIVVDAAEKPVGMYTEAMLRSAICKDPSVVDSPLADNMATVFPWVLKSDSIQTVVDAMEAKNTRFVAVLDEAGKVVGLTGQKGLMEYVAEYFPEVVMVQRIGSEPYPHRREGA